MTAKTHETHFDSFLLSKNFQIERVLHVKNQANQAKKKETGCLVTSKKAQSGV
jgi:hypothetical protein